MTREGAFLGPTGGVCMTFSSGFVHDGATLYCGEAPAMVAVSRILPHLFFTVPASSAILEEKTIQQPTYPTIIIESHARIPQKHPASPIRQNLSSYLFVIFQAARHLCIPSAAWNQPRRVLAAMCPTFGSLFMFLSFGGWEAGRV